MPLGATCKPQSTPRAGQLPSYLPGNPTYRKVNPADAPVLILALTSDSIVLPQIYDQAEFGAGPEDCSSVSGVGQVFVGGGANPAVRAEVDPNLLNKFGIGLDAVRNRAGQRQCEFRERPGGESDQRLGR